MAWSEQESPDGHFMEPPGKQAPE